tara:strand:- start:9356 stop:9733 length:378 start_codon:yes stop_codon:yes gene_type:complete
MDGIFPDLVNHKVNFYRWKIEINAVNIQYKEIFRDINGNGMVWIRLPYVNEPSKWDENLGGLLAYNHRFLDDDIMYLSDLPTISRITPINNNYKKVNHDYYVFYENNRVKEYICWQLPEKYLFSK